MLSKIAHPFRSGDLSAVDIELPLCRKPLLEVFSGVCQEPLLLLFAALVFACSRLFSRLAIFCSMSISICCSSSIISDAAYELQLPSGGLYRISKQTTAYEYEMNFPCVGSTCRSKFDTRRHASVKSNITIAIDIENFGVQRMVTSDICF